MDDKVEQLRNLRSESFARLRALKKKADHAYNVLKMVEDKLTNERLNYERIDKELAMIDGRHKVYQENEKAQKTASIEDIEAKLSKDQIIRIALQFGLNIETEAE